MPVARCRINVTSARDFNKTAAPTAREELSAFDRDERVIRAGYHNRAKRQLQQWHGSESSWPGRICRSFDIAGRNQESRSHPAFVIAIPFGIVGDGCAGSAVTRQHHRLGRTTNGSVQRLYPVRATRRFPVGLLNATVFRVTRFQNTLPVFGARVEEAWNE